MLEVVGGDGEAGIEIRKTTGLETEKNLERRERYLSHIDLLTSILLIN
jgi:hypothetical protein